jgi:chlorobactene glucosyltransferase
MRALSIIILLAWAGSLLRTIINLMVVPRLRVRTPKRVPLVSVVIPARDEERAIERTVRAMLAQTYPALEVIVVNDRSTDATGAILAAINDPRLTVITGEEPPEGWLGKPWALHQGSRRAAGELLLFVDADIHYQPETVSALLAEYEEREVSMISMLPDIVTRGFWEHVIMPNLAVFAFTILPLWLANRTRSAYLAVGGGPGNLVRRDHYDAAGGHEALRDAVVDDVAMARLMRRNGFHTLIVLADRYVSVRMYHGVREIIDGFTKNGFAVMGRSYVAALVTVIGAFVFHMLPYILALLGDRISWITVALISVTRLILFVSLKYRIDNALLGHPLMIAVWCWIMLRSLWFTGVRRQLHWRGRTYDASRTRFGAD